MKAANISSPTPGTSGTIKPFVNATLWELVTATANFLYNVTINQNSCLIFLQKNCMPKCKWRALLIVSTCKKIWRRFLWNGKINTVFCQQIWPDFSDAGSKAIHAPHTHTQRKHQPRFTKQINSIKVYPALLNDMYLSF